MLKATILRDNIVAGFNIAADSLIFRDYEFTGNEDVIRFIHGWGGGPVTIELLDKERNVLHAEGCSIEIQKIVGYFNIIKELPIMGSNGIVGHVTVTPGDFTITVGIELY
jgi:hypothetical protein